MQNAGDHARSLAARLTGEGRAYDALPWFWSIQGEARLQIAGLGTPGCVEVVRGDPGTGRFSVFLFDQDRLRAVESSNMPGDHMVARRLISQQVPVTPSFAADPANDLKALVA